MGARDRLVRRAEARGPRAAPGSRDRRGRRDLLGARPGHRHVARRALLEQQLGRLDERLGVEARGGIVAVVEHVGQRDAGSSPGGAPCRRAPRADRSRPPGSRRRGCSRAPRRSRSGRGAPARVEARRSCAARPRGVDHRGQRRGVGRDDQVLGEPALEAEAGHAEVRVLVGQLEVARVVGRLGDAPGHAALGAVARSGAAPPGGRSASSRLSRRRRA